MPNGDGPHYPTYNTLLGFAIPKEKYVKVCWTFLKQCRICQAQYDMHIMNYCPRCGADMRRFSFGCIFLDEFREDRAYHSAFEFWKSLPKPHEYSSLDEAMSKYAYQCWVQTRRLLDELQSPLTCKIDRSNKIHIGYSVGSMELINQNAAKIKLINYLMETFDHEDFEDADTWEFSTYTYQV